MTNCDYCGRLTETTEVIVGDDTENICLQCLSEMVVAE